MSVKILRGAININGAIYEITSEGKVFGAYGKPISIRRLCVIYGREKRKQDERKGT